MRIWVSVSLLVAYVMFRLFFSPFEVVTQASLATGQVSDDKVLYVLSQKAAQAENLGAWANIVLVALLAIVWIRPVLRRIKTTLSISILIVSMFLLAGCVGEWIEEIAPNETAFLIPLEGSAKSDQTQFMSEEFLNSAKIATKRITIPKRSLDQPFGAGPKWVPTVKIIKVDRTPLVREWTRNIETGTSISDQAVRVESRESIDFLLGVNASAFVSEDDAARFLYFFAGKPLAEVMDANVRGFIQRELFNEFGIRSLEEGRKEKKAIFSEIEQRAQKFFKTQGISITFIGGAEGLTYTDPKIQASINRVFETARDVETAAQELEAQRQRNIRIVEQAQADATAIRVRADAITANARIVDWEAIQKWDGKMPQITGGALPFVTVPQR